MTSPHSPTVAAYGSWRSPITAELVTAGDNRPLWIGAHGEALLFVQPVPAENGRHGLFASDRRGGVRTVLSAPWNVRNRVHEYGGRPWTSLPGTLAFTNWDDQRIYALDDDADQPRPLTPEPARRHGVRYTDLHPGPDGTVWCVRERVTGERPTDVARDVVAVPVTGEPGQPRTILATHHFLSVAKPSPDGTRIAWLGWAHPAMPWHGTELCVAELRADGTAGPHRVVAGGPREAVCQFEWSPDGRLLALTDPTGWWNLHRIDPVTGTATNLAPAEAECGGPLWTAGSQWFASLGDDRYVVLRGGHPAIVADGALTPIPGLDEVPHFAPTLHAEHGVVYGAAAGPYRRSALVAVDTRAGGYTALTPQPEDLPAPDYLPKPVSRVLTDAEGNDIPAIVYAPRNPDYRAPEGELPPYVVYVHGGPTGAVAPVLNLAFAYLTSRGIGVVAVNYGGSTGYGRAFRERLDGQWGVVDLADCRTVIEALATEGVADSHRLAISGGSAGGYTAAHAIAVSDTYRAATVRYPVIDLVRFAESETHDFESRYTYSLVGPLPEAAARYRDRSPITHVHRVSGAVLLLQGEEDAICPPEQARAFAEALDGSGNPHAYVQFPGEQHGFRRAEHIIAATEAELSFYGQVFGFTPRGIPTLELRR